MKKNVEKLKQEANTLKKDLKQAESKATKPIAAKAPSPTPPKPAPAPEPEPAPFYTAVEPESAPAKAPKGTKKVAKKAAKNVVKNVKKSKQSAVKEEQPAPASIENPWAELSPSTLKRKTVKELAAYLSERVSSCSSCFR